MKEVFGGVVVFLGVPGPAEKRIEVILFRGRRHYFNNLLHQIT